MDALRKTRFLFWTALLPAAAGAVDAPRAELQNAGFSFRTLQVEDGLPQNSVTAVVQTRDGYLWVATYGGIARFDGERFQAYSAATTPGLQDNDIVSLYEDGKVLWIGHESGAVTTYRDGRFDVIQRASDTNSLKIVGIGASESGAVWLLRDDGSLQSGSGDRVIPRREGHRLGMLQLARDTAGRLYANRDGQVSACAGRPGNELARTNIAAKNLPYPDLVIDAPFRSAKHLRGNPKGGMQAAG